MSACLNFSKFFTLWTSLSATPQQVGITAFTASALLQGIRGKLLQLHALRLTAAAKSAIADFMFKIINSSIKFYPGKFVADFELGKFLEQSVPVLIGTSIFFNPFPHTTAIKEIGYYLSVLILGIRICP